MAFADRQFAKWTSETSARREQQKVAELMTVVRVNGRNVGIECRTMRNEFNVNPKAVENDCVGYGRTRGWTIVETDE